jgi:tetratricopeptide (TPR) repeat protein
MRAVRGAARGAGLAAVGLLLAAALAHAETLSREQALAALAKRDDVAARRQGAEGLGETGAMGDVSVLTQALRDPDRGVRTLAEQSLWRVWSRSGDRDADKVFLQGVEEMQRGDLGEAVGTFTEIIKRKPDFAEAWNKRATAYYLSGEFEKSLADCDEVMKRNPVHFGALSGYGLIYLQLGKPEDALLYFERALDVNPNLAGIEQAVQAIKQLLAQQGKDTI